MMDGGETYGGEDDEGGTRKVSRSGFSVRAMSNCNASKSSDKDRKGSSSWSCMWLSRATDIRTVEKEMEAVMLYVNPEGERKESDVNRIRRCGEFQETLNCDRKRTDMM